MIGDDKNFIREILCDFQNELEILSDKIVNGFESEDIISLLQNIHNLRGISGNVCAISLYNVLSDIDAAIRSNDMTLANTHLELFLILKYETILQ